MVRIRLNIIFLVVLCYNSVSNAQTAIVKGIVSNDLGIVVKDANVYLANDKTNGTITNYKGEFSLIVPANEKIILKFSSVEYITFKKNLKLATDQIETINIELKTRTLVGVDVTAKDPGTGTTVRWEPEAAENIPSPTGNLESQLAASQVGVSQNNELSAGYNVRGGNFDENLIYLNGIEIYRPFLARSGQQEGLSFINPHMVESVIFSAGGFDANYGDKLSSVLDVYYRDPKEFRTNVTATLLGANVMVQDKINWRNSYIIGARYRTNAYLFGALDTKGEYKPVFADFQGIYNRHINEKVKLSVFGSYANNRYRVIPESRETNWGSINEALRFTVFYEGQEVTQFETFMGAISIQQKLKKDKLKLNYFSSVFRTKETESFDILGEYRLDELERDLGSDEFGEVAFNRGVGAFLDHARNDLNALVGNVYHKGSYTKGRSKWMWGSKYQHEIINDKISEWNFIDSAGFNVPSSADSVGYTDPFAQPYQHLNLSYSIKSTNAVESNRVTGYIQNRRGFDKKKMVHFADSIAINDSTIAFYDTIFESHLYLNTTLGVRAHYWDYNNQTVISPRFNINIKPAWFFTHNNQIYRRNITFKFATGLYYQPPFYRELRNIQGVLNPEIRAQKSIHFVAGMDYTLFIWDRKFKLVSEVFYKHLTDVIPYEIDNVRTRYYGHNDAKGYAAGIDLKINGQFIKDVESYASLSYLKTEEDILTDYYYDFYNSDGEKIIPGYTLNTTVVDSVKTEPGYIPRPTDQRISFALFFQDKMPEKWDTKKFRWSTFKANIQVLFGSRLPYGPPSFERYRDTLRTSLFRRVDLGFSKDIIHDKTDRSRFSKKSILHHIDKMWVALEVFNLLDIINTTNYQWITDVTGRQYSVPSALTSRRINVKFVVQF